MTERTRAVPVWSRQPAPAAVTCVPKHNGLATTAIWQDGPVTTGAGNTTVKAAGQTKFPIAPVPKNMQFFSADPRQISPYLPPTPEGEYDKVKGSFGQQKLPSFLSLAIVQTGTGNVRASATSLNINFD